MAFRRSCGVLLRKSSEMVEAKTCSNRGDRRTVGVSQGLERLVAFLSALAQDERERLLKRSKDGLKHDKARGVYAAPSGTPTSSRA